MVLEGNPYGCLFFFGVGLNADASFRGPFPPRRHLSASGRGGAHEVLLPHQAPQEGALGALGALEAAEQDPSREVGGRGSPRRGSPRRGSPRVGGAADAARAGPADRGAGGACPS